MTSMPFGTRILFPASLFFALLVEQYWYMFVPTLPYPLPIFAVAASIWFFELSRRARIIYAVFIGFFLDSVSLFPFGTNILVCVILAISSTVFQMNIIELKRRFIRPLWGIGVLVSMQAMSIAVGSLLSAVRGLPIFFSFSGLLFSTAYVLGWALVFIIILSGGILAARAGRSAL